MTTHERELTEPVDLCTPDGDRLNPAARGFSRVPLHRANLAGRFGTNKRWDYWAILAGDFAVSCVYTDIDHLGIADVYWVDLVTGESGGRSIMAPAGHLVLPEISSTTTLSVDLDDLDLVIEELPGETVIAARWLEADGRTGSLMARVALPEGHESVNVVIPWSDEEFNFTSKHQARPVTGELVVGDRRVTLGEQEAAWGVLDVGRGRWPHRINWNWGGGAGRCGAHIVGLQFGAKWTEGTGYTENGLIVDGRLSKIGRELEWTYDWEHPLEPWRIIDPGGQLDVTLVPRYDKVTAVTASDELSSHVHQVFGRYHGWLVTDEGVRIDIDALQGFAEEARQVW